MIDYATYRRIHHLHEAEKLNHTQIAQQLALHPQTVRYWLDEPTFRPRKTPVRPSKLDPYKPLIRQWLEHYPYSGTQIFQRLREAGFTGGVSIVRDYARKVRPQKASAFLTLHFEPGECAQVDWGQYGSVNVGNTRRQLSFFVLVLCYSRLMYVEFTVSQTMEHFLGCHLNAFEALGGVPARIMVDNLKSAVLQRLSGKAPVFNPRYVDFARHYGFEIAPCNVGAGHEKGRVEAGVGYVKKNLLAGLEIADFSHLNPSAREWLDTVANVRIHGETRRRPVDFFEEERDLLQPLRGNPLRALPGLHLIAGPDHQPLDPYSAPVLSVAIATTSIAASRIVTASVRPSGLKLGWSAPSTPVVTCSVAPVGMSTRHTWKGPKPSLRE